MNLRIFSTSLCEFFSFFLKVLVDLNNFFSIASSSIRSFTLKWENFAIIVLHIDLFLSPRRIVLLIGIFLMLTVSLNLPLRTMSSVSANYSFLYSVILSDLMLSSLERYTLLLFIYFLPHHFLCNLLYFMFLLFFHLFQLMFQYS